MKPTPEQREANYRWIEEHAEQCSILARNAYEKHGRGAVVVEMRDPKIPVYYVPGAPPEDQGALNLIRKYDPEREMVIVILRAFRESGELASSYRIAMLP